MLNLGGLTPNPHIEGGIQCKNCFSTKNYYLVWRPNLGSDDPAGVLLIAGYVVISALQLLCFARLRAEMPGKVPGEARRLPGKL